MSSSTSFDHSHCVSQIASPPTVTSRRQLSEWGLPPLIVGWFKNKGITSLFDWQAECLCKGRVLYGQNLVYSAPTSAGKTMVADFLMLKKVFENRKKALVIEPFIALAREKAANLKSMLWTTKARVGAFCGSYYTPGGLTAVSIAVCTIEKANNTINKLINEDRLGELGIIVVDEIHYLGDPSRGYLLELLLTKILYHNSLPETRDKIQIVGLSATLPNLSSIAKWMNAALYITDYRPVPLIEKVKIDDKIFDAAAYLENPHVGPLEVIDKARIPLTRDIDDICYICIDSIISGHSTLVFCESRRECEVMAIALADQIKHLGQKLNSEIEQEKQVSLALRKQLSSQMIVQILSKLKSCPAGADEELIKPLRFGVAFHHAGLTSEEREIIEDGFKAGAIKALMATSTLSSGVNLPARKVIIKSPTCYNNRKKEMLEPMVYKQMVGRAGRKNIDTHGESILICRPDNQEIALKLLASALNKIVSSLGYRMINSTESGDLDFNAPSSGLKKALLEVIANNTAKTRENLDVYLKSSFWLSSSSLQDQESFMLLVSKTLRFLVSNKFIEELTRNQFRATRLGKAVLASGLSPDESLELLNDLLRAREGFCLVNDLHIIYQITPNDIVKSIEIKDWINFFNIWNELDEISQYVGRRVGIDETTVAKKSRGYTCAASLEEERIYRRFLIALAINDLVNETSLPKICSKYRLSRATVQQAQRATAQFAGVLSIFCEQLGYDNIAALVTPLESRINFSCQRDLLELIKLNISRPIARALFNAGFKSVLSVAKGEALEIDFAIRQSKPFKKDASFQEKNKICSTPSLWVPELAKTMLVIEYAQHIIDTARGILEVEFDLDFSQFPMSQKPNNQTFIAPREVSFAVGNHDKRPKIVEAEPQPSTSTANGPAVYNNLRQDYDLPVTDIAETEKVTIGDMSRARDIPNFEVKYVGISHSELNEFLNEWSTRSSICLNFKVDSNQTNDPIGGRILEREKLRRRTANRRLTGLKEKSSQARRSSKSDLNSSSSSSDGQNISQDESGVKLELDIDNRKHTVSRLYACFDDEFVVYIVKSVRSLTYIQENLRKFVNKINELRPVKLYTQNIVTSYKVLYCAFNLDHLALNRCFEWHSFEVAWWMINNCPLRGRNNCQSSLSRVARTDWVPQYRHFLYPNTPQCNLSRDKSHREYLRLKDIVKSGKTAILMPLIEELIAELNKRQQFDAYQYVEIPSRVTMASMMIHGIGIGVKAMDKELSLYEDLLDQLTNITRNYYAKTNKSIVLTNNRQVAQVLYDDLNLKQYLLEHSTNSDISKDPTNAEILKILIPHHPFPRLVQDYRKIGKALEALQSVNTFARHDNELAMMRVCGKCDFWQLTGRVSMCEPDMFLINRNFAVTIPAHDHRPDEVIECGPRACFVPFANWEFISADYSQLELRLLAHFSEDQNLLAILNQVPDRSMSHDVFRSVASRIYRVTVDNVTDQKRQHAKQICYGLIYGMGNKSLGIQLGVDTDAAEEFREGFLSAFPKIITFTDALLKECEKTEYVESILGRRRIIEGINSDRSVLRSRAERVAINTKIQSSASDIIKMAMQAVNKVLLERYYERARMVLEMHDELIYEVHPSIAVPFAQILKETMENLPLLKDLRVNLIVNLKRGTNWSNLKAYEI